MIRPLKLLLLLGVVSSASPLAAESWIFRPSYYSHRPARPVEIGIQVSLLSDSARPYSEVIRSSRRRLYSTIRVGSDTFDHVDMWESWYQAGREF